MADDTLPSFPGEADLTSQALGAIHAGADPAWVKEMFIKEATNRGADPSKISFNIVNDNPDTASSKPPKVDRETKAAYKDSVIPEFIQDSNRFDYAPNKTRGEAASIEAPREVGMGEAFSRAANEAQAKTAGLLAPISYLGAQAANLATGDNVQGYSNYLGSIEDVKKAMSPQAGEDFSNVGAGVGTALGQLSVDLPQALVTGPAAAAEQTGLLAAPRAASALRGTYDAIKTGLVGGATPSASEATSVYQDAKEQGDSEIEALAKAGKAGLMKEANFALPASAGGNVLTRAATGAGIGLATSVPQEYADTGKVTLPNALTSGLLGAAMGAHGGHENVKLPRVVDDVSSSIPETGDAAFDAGVKAADFHYSDKDIKAANKPVDFDPGWTYKPEEPLKADVKFDTTPAEAVQKAQEEELARSQQARQNTDTNFSDLDRLQNAQEMSRAAIDEPDASAVPQEAPSNNALATPEMEQLGQKLSIEQATQNAGMPEQPVPVNITDAKPEFMRPSKRNLLKQKLSVDETGATVPAVEAPKAGVKHQRSIEDLIKATEAKKQIFGADTGDSRYSELPLGDELPYKMENGIKSLRDKAKPATEEQVEPFLEQDQGKLSQQTVMHDYINSRDSAHAVLEGLRFNDPALATIKSKLLNNPYMSKALKSVDMKSRGVEDMMRSSDPLDHTVRPMLAKDADGRMVATGSLGTYDGHTNSIVLRGKGFKSTAAGGHGLSPITIMHEILHAGLQHVIDGVETGKIKDVGIVRAHTELNTLRKGLKAHLPSIEGISQYQKNMLKYATSDNHEMVSVFATDPQVRQAASKVKVGDLSLWSKFKSIVAKMIDKTSGHRTTDVAVVDAIHKILDYNPNKEQAIPGLESVEPRVRGSASGEETAAKDRTPGWYARLKNTQLGMIAREGLTSHGLSKEVTQARHTKMGEVAVGDAEAVQSANRLRDVTTKGNRDDVAASLKGDVDAFQRLSPKAQDVVRNEYKNNVDRSIKIAKAIMDNPNHTPAHEAIASKILENAGSYQADVYRAREVPKAMKAKYELAKKAAQDVVDGKAISPEQKAALDSVKEAKDYLQKKWLPDLANLPKLSREHVEDLYKYYTGTNPDTQLSNLSSKDRRTAMEASIIDRAKDTINKDGEVDNLLKAAMNLDSKKSSMRKYYNNMRAPSDVFSTHQDVPPALKQLWEPVSDPIARNVASIRRQYSYLSNLRAQNNLAKEGLASGIFTKDRGSATHTDVIDGEKMGALQGLRTTPDVKRALDSVFEINNSVGDLLDSLVTDTKGTSFITNMLGKVIDKGVAPIAGFTKQLAVVFNHGNWINNLVGSPLQLVSNGNINPVYAAKGMRDAARLIGTSIRRSLPEELKDLYKYGIAEYSQISEIHDKGNQALVAKLLEDAAKDRNPLLSFLSRNKGKAMNTIREAYGTMDFWTKVANWHQQLDLWKGINERHQLFENEDALKRFVAARVNDTNITPSLSPKILRGAERLGVTRFGTYYAEVGRTLKNNFLMAGGDLKHAVELGDRQLAQSAIQRLVGAAGAIYGANYMFGNIAKGVAGLQGLVASDVPDDDARKKYMESDSFLSSTDPLILKDPLHPESGEYMYDMSHADPYAPMTTPIKTALEAIHSLSSGNSKDAKKKAGMMADQLAGLWSSNTLWQAARKIATGAPPKMKTANPDAYNQISKMLTDLGQAVSVKNADAILVGSETLSPASLKGYVNAHSEKSAVLRQAAQSGLGVQKFDVTSDLTNYIAGKSKSDLTTAKSDYLDLMKADYKSNPDRLESSFRSGLKSAAKTYDKLSAAVQAAEAQGTSRRDMIGKLEGSGVSDEIVNSLIKNKPITVWVMLGDLEKDLDKDIQSNPKDKENKKEALDRFQYNTKQMKALIRKYRNMPIEEL